MRLFGSKKTDRVEIEREETETEKYYSVEKENDEELAFGHEAELPLKVEVKQSPWRYFLRDVFIS